MNSKEIRSYASELAEDYAFGSNKGEFTPDMLTMERAMYLNYLLVEKLTEMVSQGKNPQGMKWHQILPNLDLDNWIPND
jgi:hypothetical protein